MSDALLIAKLTAELEAPRRMLLCARVCRGLPVTDAEREETLSVLAPLVSERDSLQSRLDTRTAQRDSVMAERDDLAAKWEEANDSLNIMTTKLNETYRSEHAALAARDAALALLRRLRSWSESDAVQAVECSAWAHGVKYEPADVAVWNEVREYLDGIDAVTKGTP